MRIRKPDPPLDFDEALDVVRQMFDTRRVVIEVYRPDGPVPFAGCVGWLNELRTSPNHFWIRLGTEPVGSDQAASSPAGFLIVHREGFLRAGEFMADPPGPLVIQTQKFDAVIGGSVVPDWDKLRRVERGAHDADA
jgi:hypothetical protein